MNKRRGSNHPTVKTKTSVILRDGGRCVLNLARCTGLAQTTDHRANRQAGGSRVLNGPANLLGACVRCNGDKADASGEVREDLERRGINILPASTHQKTLERVTATPVQYPDGRWYQLIDENTREEVKHAERQAPLHDIPHRLLDAPEGRAPE